jgi:hypothetical protein
MENLGVMSSFWKDHPSFVTGATGLARSWLMKSLRTAGVSVI